MIKTIDQKKLKAKHALEIYQLTADYPQHEDVLYEIVKVLQDSSRLDVAVKAEDIQRTVKTRFQDETLLDSMKFLAEKGIFSTETKGKFTYFMLLTHPWMTETSYI